MFSYTKSVTTVKETGLIKKWKNKWWPIEIKTPEISINKQIRPVTLVNIQGMIYLWAGLIGLSFIVLICEKKILIKCT